MHLLSEHNILIFLIQVFLLLGISRIMGELFRAWKQPAITAEILTGVLLGPTIFGRFLPSLHRSVFPANAVQQYMLETVAWFGLLFFLLESGLKMDFSSAWRHRGKALVIAITDIIVPMFAGFFLSYLIPAHYLVDPQKRIAFGFFMATVLTISAMPITIRTLADLNLVKTDLGFLIMSALSVNEIIGWMVFTLVLGFFIQTTVVMTHMVVMFVSAIVFCYFLLTFGRTFSNFIIARIQKKNFPEPGSSLTFICLLGLFCGAVFQKIGIHALLGFFLAGVVAGEAPALPERTRQVISQMVYAIFVPLFFARIGLNIDFFRHFNPFLVFFVVAVGIAGKFAGAWLGASFTDLPRVNRMGVAVAHTPGGAMEIVIAILALKYQLISYEIFVAIVIGGVISAVILGPWLKHSLCRRMSISALEFFSRREVVADLKAKDRDGAIRELSVIASEQGAMPSSDMIASEVLRREGEMGTAVECGISVPHARLPKLIRPTIVFGRSKSGIDWNSPDGCLTYFIFLILTPKEDDDIQIQILRIIAKAMSSKESQEALIDAPDQYAIWQLLEKAFLEQQVVRKKAGFSLSRLFTKEGKK